MKTIELGGLSPAQRQAWLQHAVAPRPIGLVSTVDAEGRPNLSPFSFFNLFSSNPPIVIFSPARRVRDNTTKHTLENVREVPEAVVHIVDASIVHQASLASCEYPTGVNEFEMAGFTAIPSVHVRPPRVKESPIHLECVVTEVKPLGTDGGAGNLVICEVKCMHVAEDVLNDDRSMIDQRRLQHTARLGGDWYCRVDETNLFEVEKPNQKLGIGFPALPEDIRHSRILTGNQLAQLANVDGLPEAQPGFRDPHVSQIVQYFSPNPEEMEAELHRHAAFLLDQGKVREAWQVLLFSSGH
jgi:flavin reductase (DIM6/NTAB) family NADH-FMN oxidoreductase RutF